MDFRSKYLSPLLLTAGKSINKQQWVSPFYNVVFNTADRWAIGFEPCANSPYRHRLRCQPIKLLYQNLPYDGWLILRRSSYSLLDVFLVFWTGSCVASHLRKANLNIKATHVGYTLYQDTFYASSSDNSRLYAKWIQITSRQNQWVSINGHTCVPHPLQDAIDDWIRASSLAAFVHWPSPVRHTAHTGFCGRKHSCKQPWQNLTREIEKIYITMTRKPNHRQNNY